jgi:hypothetical protein
VSNPLKQLKSLKHDPRFGGLDEAAKAASWAKIAAAIGVDEEPEVIAATPGVSYGMWVLTQYLSRPLMAGAFSVAVIASGWLTTVRAADSLPGQKLYSIKMLTEQAQLKLASLDRRAVLHTEFAGRRLQEAADLQGSSTTEVDNGPLVRSAIEAYKQEVTSAGENLRQLKDEGSGQALATATTVQQGLQAIDTAIDEVAAESGTAEVTQEALVAKEVTNVVTEVATAVAVEVHEEEQTEASAYDLKEMFKNGLGEIETRQRFDLERLEVIQAALADTTIDYSGLTLPDPETLLGYEYTIVAVDSGLSAAMNSFAAGGYRDAFERLQELDAALLQIEASMANIEINIMTARQQTAVVEPEDAGIESTEDATVETPVE